MAFERIGRDSPLIVEVPHGGRELPEIYAAGIRPKPDEIIRDADPYVDLLIDRECAASILVAKTSRMVVDLNRPADLIHSESVIGSPPPHPPLQRGVVWRMTTQGRRFPGAPFSKEEYEARIKRIFVPYHEALQSLIAQAHEQFGLSLVLAVHSMPSRARNTLARRADIVLGNRFGNSIDNTLSQWLYDSFRDRGYKTAYNIPYAGGYTTSFYGDPEHDTHVLQIELNRQLYMDEMTLRPSQDFEVVKADLHEILEATHRRLVASLDRAAAE